MLGEFGEFVYLIVRAGPDHFPCALICQSRYASSMYKSGSVGSGIRRAPFLTKVRETTLQLATFERVLIEGEIWNSRNVAFELRPQPDGRTEMAPSSGFW
jgi:hypothetical protein